MKNLREIPAWPSLIFVVIILAIRYHLWLEPGLSEWSFLIVVISPYFMLIGLFFIWIPYVVQTYSITSTWRDEVDERRFRIIGYVILIAVLVAMLIALYDYQKRYPDRNEVFYGQHTQQMIHSVNQKLFANIN